MRLPIVAWRNLWRHKRRTILTLLSIAFGIFLAVLFTAMQDRSFADFIDAAARMGSGHVTIQHSDYLDTPKLSLPVGNGEQLMALALADDDVEQVVERVTGQLMIATSRDSSGALFVGYDPARETIDTLAFLDGLTEGRLFESSSESSIILGSRLAYNLDLELGDRVVYQLVDRNGDRNGGVGQLVGLVETGVPSADAALCLLPIDSAREVVGYQPDESSQIALFLGDSRRSDDVAARLNQDLEAGVGAFTWDTIKPDLSGFIAMKVGGARFMEIVIMLLVAAGIFSTLFVSVMERSREFGIMMAIGHSPRQVFGLVMWESVWFALVGVAAGVLVTAFPYWHLSKNGIDMSQMVKEGTEVGGVGFDPILNVGIYPENAVLIGVAVIAATLLAGLYPAWRAARIHPVDSIKLV